MLHYQRIDISEVTDPAKSNSSKECMICHYWFFNDGFKFQDYVCNGSHNLTMFCLPVIAVINVNGAGYHCAIHNIAKSKAVCLLENSVLDDCGYI